MNIAQGLIILTPFPFSDQKSAKLRPALVISSSKFNTKSKDIWVTAISSKEGNDEFKIHLNQKDLVLGTLNRSSFIKFTAITTTEKTSIRKIVGQVNAIKIAEVVEKMARILKPNYDWKKLSDESPKVFKKYGGGETYLKGERKDWES